MSIEQEIKALQAERSRLLKKIAIYRSWKGRAIAREALAIVERDLKAFYSCRENPTPQIKPKELIQHLPYRLRQSSEPTAKVSTLRQKEKDYKALKAMKAERLAYLRSGKWRFTD